MQASVTLSSNGEVKGLRMGNYSGGAQVTFIRYFPWVGDNKVMINRSSGAYIFRPNGSEEILNSSPEISIFKGNHLFSIYI